MSREIHVRFREGLGVQFPRATRRNIYVRSRRAGERVMQSVTRFLTGRLKLKVNESKSAVARPAERKFLGFSFTSGREPKRCIAPKSLLRFKKRIRELTKRNRGVSLERMVEQLRQLPGGLARLLRLLPDALGASRSGLVDTQATPLLPMEAVETRHNPLRGTPQAGRGQRPGGPNRRQLTRIVAH